ncbi:hypothetical protein [uncultured Paraglaciecola sp.]|uniref:hypothetical protein n=1 Tax=uncultured Paraglaciecola sp. TaxID=1765024 RepID=UPI00261DC95B|nr:hypothetical protein [uncultured Paraglaciecola sp.]
MVNIKIDVTFRLFNLDKYQAITLHRELAGVTYAPYPEKNGLVGTVCLDQDLGNSNDLNIFYVRQQIPLQNCDILITVISENNQRTVATPMFVNKILKHIDCQLTFSFHPSKTPDTL